MHCCNNVLEIIMLDIISLISVIFDIVKNNIKPNDLRICLNFYIYTFFIPTNNTNFIFIESAYFIIGSKLMYGLLCEAIC